MNRTSTRANEQDDLRQIKGIKEAFRVDGEFQAGFFLFRNGNERSKEGFTFSPMYGLALSLFVSLFSFSHLKRADIAVFDHGLASMRILITITIKLVRLTWSYYEVSISEK